MGKAVQRTVWVSDDGREFKSQKEMTDHEAKAEFSAYLVGFEDYLKEKYSNSDGNLDRVSKMSVTREVSGAESFCGYLSSLGVVLPELEVAEAEPVAEAA